MKVVWYFLIGMALAIISCSTREFDESSSSVSTGGTDSITPESALTELPDVEISVPQSLAGNDMKMKMKMKAFGDTSIFSMGGLVDVQSRGWKEMRDNLRRPNPMTLFMGVLRNYASNNTIPFDEVVKLGKQPVVDEAGNTNQLEFGRILCKQIDSNSIKVYWISVIDKRLDPNNPEIVTKATQRMYFNITKSDTKFRVKMQVKTHCPTFEDWFVYGEMDDFSGRKIDFNRVNPSNFYYNSSFLSGTEEMSIMTMGAFAGGDRRGTNMTVAWGNSSIGGLMTTFNAIENNFTNERYFTEYYNSTGSLIFNKSGNTMLEKLNWMDEATNNAVNLADLGYTNAPMEYSKLVIFTNMVPRHVHTNTNGTVTNFPADKYGVYFKKGANWSSGDAIYWMDHMMKQPQTNTEFLVKGFEVPFPENHMGKNYYIRNSWPLKYLTLSTNFDGYLITRKELDTKTNTNFFTEMNVTKTNIFSWTGYEWWLDSSSNMLFNPDSDVRINNIQEEEIWKWDEALQMPKPEKAYFVHGTKPRPQYFDFSQKDTVSNIQNNIINAYNTYGVSFTVESFLESIEVFPDSQEFPDISDITN